MSFKIERFPLKVLLSVLILVLIMLIPAAAFAQTANPEISIKKSISIDGGTTWADADTLATAPSFIVPRTVHYKFVLTNSGNVALTAITLTDNLFGNLLNGATITYPFAPGASQEFLKQRIVYTTGLHSNTATATAVYAVYTAPDAVYTAPDVVYTASDWVYYYGYSSFEYIPPAINPSITVKKYVSIDGGSWLDAETAPGPSAVVGSIVRFRFVVTNSGNVTLGNITLTDNKFSLIGATIPASLVPGESFEYILTGITALAGQHSNTATATGIYGQQVISDTDAGHYFGSATFTASPSISVKKHVSVDNGATWWDAETIAAGPDAVAGAKVKFRFKVTNTGNVTLTNITLADSEYSLSGVTVPATLAPGASFEGNIEVTAVKGRHVNTATATGRHEGQTYSDTDNANYYGHEPYTSPVTPDPVEPTPEPAKPKPTPSTDGDYTSGLYYALILFILAAIILKKSLSQV